MNCEEILVQLSEFLGQTLDRETSINVGEHLAACRRCSEELAGLAEYHRLLSKLNVVEPPAEFITRVMADVRQAAHRPGIMQRLFPPVFFKIPLQAAAVVFIGILSVYLYQKEDTGRSPAKPIAQDPVSSVRQESIKSESVQPPGAAPAGRSGAIESKAITGEAASPKAPTPAATATPKAPKAEAAPTRLEAQPGKFKSAPIPAQSVTTAQEGSSFPGELAMRGAGPAVEALRQSGVRPAPFPAERLSLLSEPIPDYELVVRRRQQRRTDQVTSTGSQDLAQKQSGNIAASKSPESHRELVFPRGTNPPLEILWFSVPYDRYEQFKKELAAQAVVESETPVAVKEKEASFIADRPLSIKVTVLPPAER